MHGFLPYVDLLDVLPSLLAPEKCFMGSAGVGFFCVLYDAVSSKGLYNVFYSLPSSSVYLPVCVNLPADSGFLLSFTSHTAAHKFPEPGFALNTSSICLASSLGVASLSVLQGT